MKFRLPFSTLASIGIASACITCVSALTFSKVLSRSAIAQQAAPTVTTTSSNGAIDLAKHLRNNGAKLYTVFWCPHCYSQKERFGKEAIHQLEVIECDDRGVNPQRQLCISQKVRGYPTWEIDGKLYGGDRSLDNLAEISEYRGRL